jgi:hypothetical protein
MLNGIEITQCLHVAVCTAPGCLEKATVLVHEIDSAGRTWGRRELCAPHGWSVAERARHERRPIRLFAD